MVVGCASSPADVGIARYFGEMNWNPARPLPPIRDRSGNVYLGFNFSLDSGCPLTTKELIVLDSGGGWSDATPNIPTDYQNPPPSGWPKHRYVHGWVGFGNTDAYFWSGDVVWKVLGDVGMSKQLLPKDPQSRTNVAFLAVAPWLRDRPLARTIPALIQLVSDPVPYHVVIDVDRGLYTNLRPFSPSDATLVTPMGVAGNLDQKTAVMILWYVKANVGHVVAKFINEDGNDAGTTEITGLQQPASADPTTQKQWLDSVVGFGAMKSDRTTAALLALPTGNVLLMVTPSSSTVTPIDPATITPLGVQLWDDKLWLVGADSAGGPLLAPIGSDGTVGGVEPWSTSLSIAQDLGGSVSVVDERTLPRKTVTWQGTASAIGASPFLAPFSMLPYVSDSVGWLIGGPSYVTPLGATCRSVAFVPLKVAYP